MSDPNDPGPPPEVPPRPHGERPWRPARRRGASRSDAVPRMENVRVTAPDLARRAALEKSRSRLVIAAAGFTALFTALLAKLTLATIVMPMAPHRPERSVTEIVAAAPHQPVEATLPGQRATITDRNGQPMAISLNTVSLFADPRQIGDVDDAARKLKQVLPRLDLAETTQRLHSDKKFIYLAREITPREELAINDLGIPGIDFRPTQHRQYPLGRTAAQVLGGVDVDESGFAGVEKYFDERLRTKTDAAAPVDRSAGAGGSARGTRDCHGNVRRDRRLRHRYGCPHRRSAGDGQLARLRRQFRADRARRGPLQPSGRGHL